MMLHVRPELTHLDKAVSVYPDTGSPYLTTDLIGDSAIRTYHDFADLSPTGTLGDPDLANPEKGSQFFAAAISDLASFIEDFRGWPISEQ